MSDSMSGTVYTGSALHRTCPVCEATSARLVHEMRFALPDEHPLANAYAVVSCVECGVAYANTPSLQSDYDRYYADLSKYSDATGTGGGQEDWDRSRLRDTAAFLAQHLDDRSSRVVDVGCANGGLLRELREYGFTELEGVDPSPACVAAVAANTGLAASVGTLFALPSDLEPADCLVLSHVLEHVREVPKALAATRRALRPNGRIYVEVPDATRYAAFLTAPFQEFNIEHINHFSPTTLQTALMRAGFVPERCEQKAINASATTRVPAIGVLARRVDSPDRAVSFDRAAVDAITEYVRRSRDALRDLQAVLDHALAGVPEIVIWGTGQTTLTLLSNVRFTSRIAALTDSSPRYHGRRLGGIPVVPPEQLSGFDAPIVIGSIISHAAIERRVHELGLPNRVIGLNPREPA